MTVAEAQGGSALWGAGAALTAAALWAVATVLYRSAVRSIRPMSLNILKGLVALPPMVALLFIFGDPIAEMAHHREVILLAISGVLGIGLGDTLFFYALDDLGPRRTLLMGVLAPPLAAIIALLSIGETITLLAWMSIFITAAGVAWVITERQVEQVEHPAHLKRGVIIALLAALTQAGAIVLSRAALADTDVTGLFSAAVRMVAGVAVLFIFWPIRLRLTPTRKMNAKPWHSRLLLTVLLAAAMGTFLGIWLQQIAVKHAPAGITQTLLATSPIYVLPIVAAMGERVSIRAVLGAIVALSGTAVLVWQTQKY